MTAEAAPRALAPAVDAPVDAPRDREREALLRKLSWSTLFRLATVTVLLGGTAVSVWSEPGLMQPAAAPLFQLVLVTYVASLVLALLLRRRLAPTLVAYGHVALDVLVASTVVALTGRSESVFVFMYLLGIVNGGVLLFRRGATAAALLSVAAYLAVALRAGRPEHGATLAVHAFAFLATAALASYLAEQLRRTGERLEAREDDLAAITALHEAIVQSVSSGLVTVDGEDRVTFLNKAGEGITGLSAAEARGQPLQRVLGDLQEGGARGEADFTNARGERLRFGYTVSPLLARGRGAIGRAVVFQDLTQVRVMEDQMQRGARLAELGRVAAGLAHELRNPLASMAGSIELLKGAPGLSHADARLMDIVLREAERLEGLVAAFLAFSRPVPPRPAAVELDRIVADTLDVFAHDPAAARVRVERALHPTPAFCDPDQARQVLWNLLTNAAHAAARGEGQPPGTVRVGCRPEAGAAELRVADDGPGVAAHDLGQLFTPFFTTKERGTGLGLATVQRIVDGHGGRITVESAPGRGATFTVRLPAAPAAAG